MERVLMTAQSGIGSLIRRQNLFPTLSISISIFSFVELSGTSSNLYRRHRRRIIDPEKLSISGGFSEPQLG